MVIQYIKHEYDIIDFFPLISVRPLKCNELGGHSLCSIMEVCYILHVESSLPFTVVQHTRGQALLLC